MTSLLLWCEICARLHVIRPRAGAARGRDRIAAAAVPPRGTDRGDGVDRGAGPGRVRFRRRRHRQRRRRPGAVPRALAVRRRPGRLPGSRATFHSIHCREAFGRHYSDMPAARRKRRAAGAVTVTGAVSGPPLPPMTPAKKAKRPAAAAATAVGQPARSAPGSSPRKGSFDAFVHPTIPPHTLILGTQPSDNALANRCARCRGPGPLS